jgi:nickel-dependent lactate racemase
MKSASTLEEAYEMALSIAGKEAETVVIPDGIGVIVG